jgi:hypothetical protein
VTEPSATPALVAVAQAQLDAYNAQDLDLFCSYFADTIEVADFNGAVTLSGIDAYREKYRAVFSQFPQNRVELLGRIAVGAQVIDHERVRRSPDAAPFEVAAIYTLRGHQIVRVDFVK